MSDAQWSVHNEDCLDTLEFMLSDSVDLTVTSPPYDNLRTYNGYCFNFEEVARELYRVTKPGGVVVWNVNDATVDGSETGTSFRQALFFKDCGFNLHDTMIYQKANPGGARGSNYAYWQSFEFMFVFSKGRPKTTNLLHDRPNADGGRTGKQGGRRAKDGSVDEGRVITTEAFGRRTNIWKYATTVTDKLAKGHPAPFPEALARDHIISWSNRGDLVFDPFTGSGTTGKVARELGRRFIGADISKDYVEMARRRIAESVAANDSIIQREDDEL